MSDEKQPSEVKQGTGKSRRVRVVNPKSTFFNWKGKLEGVKTPEDGLIPVRFSTLNGPIHFREGDLADEAETD